MRDRESLAQAADFLLGLKDVCAAVVFGVMRGRVYISARTAQPGMDLGAILRRAFGNLGSAGGHATHAGASVSLGALVPRPGGRRRGAPELASQVRKAVRELYARAAGLSGGPA